MSDDILDPPLEPRNAGKPYPGSLGALYPTMRQPEVPRRPAPTAEQKATEAAQAKLYPSMSQNPRGPRTGDRNTGELNKPREAPDGFREATEQDRRNLKRYPSLATPKHYDARIVGKNPDGSDKVMIRARNSRP